MLTQQILKSLLTYNPETGVFHRRVSGETTGHFARYKRSLTRYVRIYVDGKSYYAHRLAWLYMTGAWPNQEIDHIDRCGDNNSWANLREVTHSQNQANTATYKSNKVGQKGVHLFGGRYRAMISQGGRNRHIGYFDTPEAAAAAYQAEASKIYGTRLAA